MGFLPTHEQDDQTGVQGKSELDGENHGPTGSQLLFL